MIHTNFNPTVFSGLALICTKTFWQGDTIEASKILTYFGRADKVWVLDELWGDKLSHQNTLSPWDGRDVHMAQG